MDESASASGHLGHVEVLQNPCISFVKNCPSSVCGIVIQPWFPI